MKKIYNNPQVDVMLMAEDSLMQNQPNSVINTNAENNNGGNAPTRSGNPLNGQISLN